jgi:hypothetical protein
MCDPASTFGQSADVRSPFGDKFATLVEWSGDTSANVLASIGHTQCRSALPRLRATQTGAGLFERCPTAST